MFLAANSVIREHRAPRHTSRMGAVAAVGDNSDVWCSCLFGYDDVLRCILPRFFGVLLGGLLVQCPSLPWRAACTLVPLAPSSGLRISSRNTGGLLDSVASSRRTTGKEHHCLQRLCEFSIIVCLQETRGEIEFFRSLSTVLTQAHVGNFRGRERQCGRICHHYTQILLRDEV